MQNSSVISMQKISTILGVFVWVVLVCVVLFAMTLEDRFFAVSGNPIATLLQVQREVTVRSENDINWRPVATNQKFFDGDRVSTGVSSTVTIDFGDGKKGVVGPESIVAISSINQASGRSFIVNLIKGGIKPIVPKNAKSQLIVTSGSSTFYVEPGQSKGFTKPVGGTIREFSQKDRFPGVAKVPKSQSKTTISADFAAKAEQSKAIVVVDPTPTQSLAPPLAALPELTSQAQDLSEKTSGNYIDPTIDKVTKSTFKDSAAAPKPDASLLESLRSNVALKLGFTEGNTHLTSATPDFSATRPTSLTVTKSFESSEKTELKPVEIKRPVAVDPEVKEKGLSAKLLKSTPSARTASTELKNKTKGIDAVLPVLSDKELANRYLPQVDMSKIATVFHTTSRMADVKPMALDIPAIRPKAKIESSWSGGVEVTIGSQKQVHLASNGIAAVPIDGTRLKNAKLEMHDGVPCVRSEIRSFAKFEVSGKVKTFKGKEAKLIRFCSLAEFEMMMPIQITYSGFGKPFSDNSFFVSNEGSAAMNYRIVTNDSSDYLKLLPYLRRARGLKVESKVKMSSEGMFGARGSDIVIQYSLEAANTDYANKISRLLGHSVVYKGQQNAIMNTKGMSIEEFKEWVVKNTSEGRDVYVRMNGKLVPISRDFLTSREEVADFVRTTATTVYLDDVDIVYSK
jgi:hypothetical protein